MSEAIQHTCVDCGQEMTIPTRYLGTNQKCRKCGAEFLVAQPTTKKCPFCAEEIKVEAVVCRFCNRSLTEADQPPPEGGISPKAGKDTKDQDQLGIALALPWFAGAFAIYLFVWQSPRFLAPSRLGMVSLITLGVAAALVAVDANKIFATSGEKVGDQSAGLWAMAVVLLAIIVAPLYAFQRGKVQGFSSRYTLFVLLGVLVYAGMTYFTWALIGT